MNIIGKYTKNRAYIIVLVVLFVNEYATAATTPKNEEYSPIQTTENGTDSKPRHPRTLLGVIKFENKECEPLRFPGREGTCYSNVGCLDRGGIDGGPCANGYGVCCFFLYTKCGDKSNVNNSYWSNPSGNLGYNAADTCLFTVNKASADICQLRLDMEVFDVRRPHKGDCEDDRFTVSGQSINSHVPILCGLNNFQHLYMDISSSNGPIIFTMTTIGSYERRWLIKVSQIACRSESLAPSGCLQYFVGATGILESFNYEEEGLNGNGAKRGYLNNLEYSMCFRKELGACSISLQKEPTVLPPFHIDTALRSAAAGHIECPKDYLIFNNIRLCGIHLNDDLNGNPTKDAIVTENTNGPFLARFKSDATVTHRGFKLMFRQNPCASG